LPQSPPENLPKGVPTAWPADVQADSPDAGSPGVEAEPIFDAGVVVSGAAGVPAAADLDLALAAVAGEVALDLGLSVVGLRLLSHRIPLTVQVLVQRADGLDVSLDECARFSAPLGEALEASGLLTLSYMLEVSSPGIGEELASDRDFTSFRGFPVEVTRQAEGGGEQLRQGLLLGRDERMVLLNMRGRTVRIPREEVVRVRLICPTDDS
jgi:ribosome maturation factor RimP